MILLTPAEIYEELIKKIDLQRKQLSYTQNQLAQKAGISSRTYQSLLEGKAISVPNLLNLMYALSMDDELAILSTPTPAKSTQELLQLRAIRLRKRIRHTTKKEPS